MKINFRKLITLLAVFVGLTSACAKSHTYPKAPAYVPLPGGEFPIVASYAFYPPFINETQFRWVREAGFNILRKSLDSAQIDSCLHLAERNDLYIMVSPWNITDVKKVPSIIEKYKDRKAVWGYGVADEPNYSKFALLGKVMKEIETLDPAHNGYINLLPEVSENWLGVADYRTYVEDFVEIVNPPFLSFDCYPVRERKNGNIYIAETFYPTQEIIMEVAKESERPFWGYVLCNKSPSYPKPREGFLRFQVFTALGYGAQGLNYFTYLLPDFDRDKGDFSYSPINSKGQRTAVWNMVRNVNAEVHSLSDVFLGCEVVSVTHTGEKIPEGTVRNVSLPAPFGIIESFGEGVMVSHLRNGQDEYLLVVNRDVLKKQKVYLSHSEPVTRLYGDGHEQTVTVGNFTLDAGGYLLLKF